MTAKLALGTISRRTALAVLGAAMAQPLHAQEANYPSRRITLLVPYAAGSTNDIFARILAEGLSPKLGQSIIVENRPGAGGTVGIGQVIRAAPDGYTLALISTSSVAINRALYTNLSYDPAKDLVPVSIPATTPNALIVAADQEINSVEDLVRKGKAATGTPLRHFSPGNGTSQHLSAVLFSRLAGIKAENIPYKGQEGITGMIGGQTQYGFATVPSVVGLVNAGKIKVLGITGDRPSAMFPSAPTLASLGYPEFAYGQIWYGAAAPAKAPAAIREKLGSEIAKLLAEPGIQEKLLKAGFEIGAVMTGAEQEAFIGRQVTFWEQLVKESGATPE